MRGPCFTLLLFFCLVHATDDQIPDNNLTGKACIAKARGRGVGVALDSCPNGTEQNGLLCYHPCSPGYNGVGPVCWKSCPDGSKDTGTVCIKSHGKGIVVKHSYGRGSGSPLHCSPDKEENGGVCYKVCTQGYEGEGPVCWEQVSPAGFPHKCNTVLYTADKATCDTINSNLAKTGSYTAACVGLAVAVASSAGVVDTLLQPAASYFCGKAWDAVLKESQQVLQLTHAKACLS